jgi:hypothetical protein
MSYMKSSASAKRGADPATLGNGLYQGASSGVPDANHVIVIPNRFAESGRERDLTST